MPHITSNEQLAREEALCLSLRITLEARFGVSGLALAKELESIDDEPIPLQFHKYASTAPSVDELRKTLSPLGLIPGTAAHS